MAEPDPDQLAGEILAGIVTCGVLAGESDGEVKAEEVEALVAIVTGFLEGVGASFSLDDVRTTTGEIAQLVSDAGAEQFLVNLPQMLTDDDQRRMGCMVAATVLVVDGELTRSEARMYDRITEALGLSVSEAQEIWDEVMSDDEDEGGEGGQG